MIKNASTLFNRLIAAFKPNRIRQFGKLHFSPNFKQSRIFVLAWDSKLTLSDKKHIAQYIEYLKNEGKKVVRIVYFDVKTKDDTPLVPEVNTFHIGRWDFDRSGYPKGVELKNILRQEIDFFISLDLVGEPHFIGMATLCKAACKVAYLEQNTLQIFDVLLKQNEKQGMKQYLCDLKEYLNKLG